MSDSVHTLDDFKSLLSQTFEKAPVQGYGGAYERSPDNTQGGMNSLDDLNDSFDSYDDFDEPAVTYGSVELNDDFDDLYELEDAGGAGGAETAKPYADVKMPTAATDCFEGIHSTTIVSKPCSLKDEIKNTIYNLGFTMENCITEYNNMFGTNLSSMEELYSCIIYNNYFKRVTVTDINSLSTADLMTPEPEIEAPVELTESKNQKIEQELASVEYPDFIREAVENNRIPEVIFDKYNDLFKALYVVDYTNAFGEEIELSNNSDVVYTVMVGRYMYGMSDLDYKKIMYLLFRTDMSHLITEKGSVESYADITFYKISKLIGIDVDPDDKKKFYISKNGKMQSFNVDIVWHNADVFLDAVQELEINTIDGKLLFFDNKYNGGQIVNSISSESSLTEFVSKPVADSSFFYYNYNKFLDMIQDSNIDASEELCEYFTSMTDLDIARYDFVFGNIVKYNNELVGCITSERFRLIFNCMFYLPGREPIAYASYRLLSLLCPAMYRDKFELATKNMTQELSRDCVSIDIIGIPEVNMIKLSDFWLQFDAIRTYFASASKITLSVFNSVIRLKIK